MKRALLLSVVASVAVMAGGDIAPAPVVEESNWEWGGTAKVYYQTMDHENYALGNGPVVGNSNDFFDRRSSAADAGLQLRVSNKDVIAGIGFGVEMTGLSTLNLVNAGVVTASMQSAGLNINEFSLDSNGDLILDDADNALSSAWISQAYLTYGFGNTSFKIGRQELPKSLSPFAFSEGWNVFKNTFEAALIVNTDIADTTLVGAYVNRANGSLSYAGSIVAITAGTKANHFAPDLADWRDVGENGTYMLTAQNKSIAGLTATGSFYYAPSFAKDGTVGTNTAYLYNLAGVDINNGSSSDAMVLWGDLAYNNADFPVTAAVQGGFISADTSALSLPYELDDTTAWGAKIGGKIAGFALSAAYTSVNIDGAADGLNVLTVTNFGTSVKSPLYTQQVLNQVFIDGHFGDSDTWQIKGVYKGLGGKFVAQYASSDLETKTDDYAEFDFIYATKFNTAYGDIGAKAMWMNQSFPGPVAGAISKDDSNNVLRLIASYDF